MLPTKAKNLLIAEFRSEWKLLTKRGIHKFFMRFDTSENVNKLYSQVGKITKIVYKTLGDDPVSELTDITDKRYLKVMIRSNPKRNYHDYLTNFKFIETHPLYDLIVEVIYKYVYT